MRLCGVFSHGGHRRASCAELAKANSTQHMPSFIPALVYIDHTVEREQKKSKHSL